MSSSGHRIFLAGIGQVGSAVIKAAQSDQYRAKTHLFVLIRKETLATADNIKKSLIDSMKTSGNIHIIEGDIKDSKFITETLLKNQIETVISVVGRNGFADQPAFLAACQEVSTVKLFIPSEFGGFDQTRLAEIPAAASWIPIAKTMLAFRDQVAACGIDYLIIHTGFFAEYILAPFGGYYADKNLIEAPSSWDTRISASTLSDIGMNTLGLIFDPSIRNQKVHISSFDASYEEIAAAIEKKTGELLTRKIVTQEEIVERMKTNFIAIFGLFMIHNLDCSWDPKQSWNLQNANGAKTCLTDAVSNILKLT